jgi:hypothetical protein
VLEGWIKNSSIAESPNALIAAIAGAIIWLTSTVWFLPVLVGSVGIAAILWGAYIYSRWTYFRGLALEEIGDEMLVAARYIAGRQGGFRNPWPANIADGRGKLSVLCTRIRRWRIYAPSESEIDRPDSFTEIHRYFDFVGNYLKNGNRKEAKAQALETKDRLKQ